MVHVRVRCEGGERGSRSRSRGRSLLLVVLAWGLAASIACSRQPQAPVADRGPSFLVILADDLGWADTGVYGSSFYQTPAIDRLASEGLLFTNAYATGPVCSPTRASLMTGKYPTAVQLTNALPSPSEPSGRPLEPPKLSDGLALSETTIAEALRQEGYVTGIVGKWHLGDEEYFPDRQGFDFVWGVSAFGMVHDYFYPAWTRRHPRARGVNTGLPAEGSPGEYLPEKMTREAVAFIEENRDRPFFLYLSHYLVHSPIQAKQERVAEYETRLEPDDPQNNPIYAAMVEALDDSVAEILAALDELGLAENTVVLLTSDNGGLHKPDGMFAPDGATSNAPLREGKKWIYEGGVRVPLIVRWPGVVEAGSRTDALSASVDLFPTLLDLAGGDLSRHPEVSGVSLASALRGGEIEARELYWHFPHYSGGQTPAGAVRSGDFKLIELYEEGRAPELYNLREDLGETNDLAEQMPEKTAELLGLLRSWRERESARMPTPGAL